MFILLLIIIPFGLLCFRQFCYDKFPPKTAVQKKNFDRNLILVFFLWYMYLFFYLAWFNDWIECQFILGVAILAVTLLSLAKTFSSQDDKHPSLKGFMVFDLLLGLGLTIYLLYIIPDKELQTVAISITAAVYGGFITLVGVAWTIRKSDADRLKEEIAKNKPVFTFGTVYEKRTQNNFDKDCSPSKASQEAFTYECIARIENSNLSSFEMKSITHDGQEFPLEGNVWLIPNNVCMLSFRLNNFKETVLLKVSDAFGREYTYKLIVGLNDDSFTKKTPSFIR